MRDEYMYLDQKILFQAIKHKQFDYRHPAQCVNTSLTYTEELFCKYQHTSCGSTEPEKKRFTSTVN